LFRYRLPATGYRLSPVPCNCLFAILRDGKLVYLMQRFVIENSTPQAIADELSRAFNELCAKQAV